MSTTPVNSSNASNSIGSFTPIDGQSPASPMPWETASSPQPQPVASDLNANLMCDPEDERRVVTLFGWELFDLGPRSGGYGCGSAGTEFVFDSLFGTFDMRRACWGHDRCSTAIGDPIDTSLGEVVECQADFAKAIYDDAPSGFFGKLGGAIISGVYTAAVSTVALGQWAVDRFGRGLSAIARAVGSLF